MEYTSIPRILYTNVHGNDYMKSYCIIFSSLSIDVEIRMYSATFSKNGRTLIFDIVLPFQKKSRSERRLRRSGVIGARLAPLFAAIVRSPK